MPNYLQNALEKLNAIAPVQTVQTKRRKPSAIQDVERVDVSKSTPVQTDEKSPTLEESPRLDYSKMTYAQRYEHQMKGIVDGWIEISKAEAEANAKKQAERRRHYDPAPLPDLSFLFDKIKKVEESGKTE